MKVVLAVFLFSLILPWLGEAVNGFDLCDSEKSGKWSYLKKRVGNHLDRSLEALLLWPRFIFSSCLAEFWPCGLGMILVWCMLGVIITVFSHSLILAPVCFLLWTIAFCVWGIRDNELKAHFVGFWKQIILAVVFPLCFSTLPWNFIGLAVYLGVFVAIDIVAGWWYLVAYIAWAMFGLSLRWDTDKMLDTLSWTFFGILLGLYYIVVAPYFFIKAITKPQLSIGDATAILVFLVYNGALAWAVHVSPEIWPRIIANVVGEALWFLVAIFLGQLSEVCATVQEEIEAYRGP